MSTWKKKSTSDKISTRSDGKCCIANRNRDNDLKQRVFIGMIYFNFLINITTHDETRL